MQRLAVQIGGGQCGSEEIAGDRWRSMKIIFERPKGLPADSPFQQRRKLVQKFVPQKKYPAALRRCSSERCVKVALKWPGQTVAHK